jgi:signal transduction histidine kinase
LNVSLNEIGENEIAYTDEDMMKLVLRNLISNAIKFTEANGEINIQSEQVKDFLQITVADNGKGISKSEQGKLFDIRENLSTDGTAEEKGTDLGLGLCKDCVDKNHGRIWVESELGKGSKFHFTVPLIQLVN